MKFTQGFQKIAVFDHNNQGQEFKLVDTEPLVGTGAGGMAPSGIASYQPIVKQETDKIPSSKRKGKPAKLGDKEVANLIVTKLSQEGSRAGITGTTVTQLKYESSSPWSHEQVGEGDMLAKERAKKYERAKKK